MLPGWDITDERLECPKCLHVFPHSQELDQTSAPCPVCGEKGLRSMFPDFTAASLIHMAAYFFVRGEKRRSKNQTHQKATYEEHIATVLMACSASEYMLKDLVIDLGVWSGVDPEAAETEIDTLNRPGQIYGKFADWAGCSYEEAARRVGFSEFREEWVVIRKRRNDFMHGDPNAIDRPTAAKTYVLLPRLIEFFASLRNHFAPDSA